MVSGLKYQSHPEEGRQSSNLNTFWDC